MKRVVSFVAATVVAATTFIAFAGTAAAHERRTIGPYQFVVGWLNEPAYVGLMNSLDLRVTDTRQSPPTPVEGLEKTLTVELQTGGLAPFPLTVTARFGTPGAYNGHAMPTATGIYIFRIRGKVGTLDIDEKFESGPGRFGDVEATTALQYPTKVSTGTEVGDRLAAIQSDVGQIRLLAAAAMLIGIVALGASVAVSRRRA